MSYALVAGVFLFPAAVLALAATATRPSRRWWIGTPIVIVVLFILTAVFENIMIAADLFRYDEDALLGWRVFLVPVEDFAWPLASGLALPALWVLLGRRHQTNAAKP